MSTEQPIYFSPDSSALAVNQEGNILAVTDEFCRMFDWPREKIVGQPLSIIIPPNLKDAHNMGFSRFLVTGQGSLLNKSLDLEIVTGTGEVKLATHFITHDKAGMPHFSAEITLRSSMK